MAVRRVETRKQFLLPGERQRHERRVQALSGTRQAQMQLASVPGAGSTFEQGAPAQGGHSAADTRLMHAGAVGDLLRRAVRLQADRHKHTPLRDLEAKAL